MNDPWWAIASAGRGDRGAWIVAALFCAPLHTDNRPRLDAWVRPFRARGSNRPAKAGRQEAVAQPMKNDDPEIKWIEEPKLGLAGKMYLPLFVQGLTTTPGTC